MSNHFRDIFIVLVAALPPLAAQNFGEITGTVMDASGSAIVGAQVTITSTTTNQSRKAATNDAGSYSAPFLVPGVYDVSVASSGFKVATRRAVDLQVDAVARIDFQLQVGEVTQQVEVTGGAPLVDTENTALGTVIENRRIVDLPLNGRNYLQLVTLSPNVTTEGGSGGAYNLGGLRAQTSLSIAGQRLEFNRYTLDGVENTDPNWNSWIIGPSVDAIQEFKVQTGVYSAEFGRGSAQINVTTKAGGNAFHGTAFEFLRNSALDARGWLQSQGAKNPFRRNQYGFTLGGPVWIPKVFNGKEVGDLFKGFDYFLPSFVAALLIGVFAGIGFLLCIVPGLVIASMYKFTYLFILDKKMDFWPAMEASHSVVKNDYFGFTMFLLAMIGINILGALCCIVGLLVTVPMTIAAITIAYQEVVGFEQRTVDAL